MKKNQIIFEEVESKISEMLERLSANERKHNVGLCKVERRMQRIMKRLKRLVNASPFVAQEPKEGVNANV